MKGTGVIPVLGAHVRLAGNASSVDDDTEYTESYHCGYFDDGEDEFSFSIASNTEKVDAGSLY